MDVFEEAHFVPLQKALLVRIRERFPLGERFLVSDTTNYYPFIVLGVDVLLERLQGMQEALVVYVNGAAQRVLTQRSPEQEELFVALNLRPLAEQLGNTVLDL